MALERSPRVVTRKVIPPMVPDHLPAWLTPRAAAVRLGLSNQSLLRTRLEPDGWLESEKGDLRPLYSREQIERYLASRTDGVR